MEIKFKKQNWYQKLIGKETTCKLQVFPGGEFTWDGEMEIVEFKDDLLDEAQKYLQTKLDGKSLHEIRDELISQTLIDVIQKAVRKHPDVELASFTVGKDDSERLAVQSHRYQSVYHKDTIKGKAQEQFLKKFVAELISKGIHTWILYEKEEEQKKLIEKETNDTRNTEKEEKKAKG